MKKLSISLSLILLASCAGHYRRPESIESKMARYESKKESINKIPEYKEQRITTGARNPASSEAEGEALSLSNLSIYFMALHDQYQAMSSLYPEYKESLKVCPTFHQELTNKNSSNYQYERVSYQDLLNDNFIKTFISDDTKNVDNFKNSMKQYMTSTHKELVQLCETGASDNYYIFENLITINQSPRKLKKDVEGLNTLYKVSVFYNEALLKKISTKSKMKTKTRSIASSTEVRSYENEALVRMKANWANDLLK